MERRASGTTFLEISGRQFGEIEVPLPPIREQRRIAEILDTLDMQIRATRRVVHKLKQARNGVLSGFVDAIPSDTLRPLSALCIADICYGIVQSGPYVLDGVSVLAIRDLQGDFETGLHRTSPSIDRHYRRSRVAPGDVLLSIKGTIGRVGVAPDYYRGNISREIARLRFSTAIDPNFAYQYFLSEQAQRKLDLAVVGTTRAEVSIHVLKRFELPAPDMEFQRRIVADMKKIDGEIHLEETTLEKQQSVRLGLARDLLTGRVRVPQESMS